MRPGPRRQSTRTGECRLMVHAKTTSRYPLSVSDSTDHVCTITVRPDATGAEQADPDRWGRGSSGLIGGIQRMRHAVVLLLAVSLSGFPATGEVLTPAPGLRSGAVASAPPATAAQLPPEIMVDRHLVRVDRLLAADDPGAALEAMNEILALQEEHDLELGNDFPFRYARVAFAAGRTETAIASLNEYLVAAGREGEFYREALQLLDSAEVRLAREEVERRRAEAERRRAARWPPGHVFRDCETCPEMVVLPGSTSGPRPLRGDARRVPGVRGGDRRRRWRRVFRRFPCRWRLLLAGSGLSADRSPSRDVREPGRRPSVCVLAQPHLRRGVPVAQPSGMAAGG